MTYTSRFILQILILLITPLASACWIFNGHKESSATAQQPVPYTILNDYMGTEIKIAVTPSVTPEQLRMTLRKAADDHQDDPARDYLTSMFLWIDAYLVDNQQASSVPAGRLRRYVPPGNPAERRRITTDRSKDDNITITIDEAKKTLR